MARRREPREVQESHLAMPKTPPRGGDLKKGVILKSFSDWVGKSHGVKPECSTIDGA